MAGPFEVREAEAGKYLFRSNAVAPRSREQSSCAGAVTVAAR